MSYGCILGIAYGLALTIGSRDGNWVAGAGWGLITFCTLAWITWSNRD